MFFFSFWYGPDFSPQQPRLQLSKSFIFHFFFSKPTGFSILWVGHNFLGRHNVVSKSISEAEAAWWKHLSFHLWGRGSRGACPPDNPLAFSITRSMVPLLPSASGLNHPFAAKISFSSVVQPQEANIAVTSRNMINHIIHKLTIWGNKPFGGVGSIAVAACIDVLLGSHTSQDVFVYREGTSTLVWAGNVFFLFCNGEILSTANFFLTGSEC